MILSLDEMPRSASLIIECPECGTTRYLLESPSHEKEYRCSTCGTGFVFRKTEECPEGPENKSSRALGWKRAARRVASIAVASILLIIAGGSSVAIAKPEHRLAVPFKSMAMTLMQASSGAVSLTENIREIVAAYERSIVSEALQSMRTIEGLNEVPAVTAPTNDMALFPSVAHSLFPDYLDKRVSQFKYTVDSKGIISVDTSGATTDVMLAKIDKWADRLAE
jgi:ribosomal protein S27E